MRVFTGMGLALVLSLFAVPAFSAVTAASVFGDNMVLQQQMPVPVWGTAAAGEAVTVTFGRQHVATKADQDGHWRVTLKKLRASATPAEMTIAGSNTLTFHNVLVGEVWVCSGQSNMEFSVGGTRDARNEVAAANYPLLRMFTVGKHPSGVPLTTCSGSWQVCAPSTVGNFSAAGYFFARELQQALQVPIGMIHTSWGGTPAETWTSMPGLKALPVYHERAELFEKACAAFATKKDQYETERQKLLKAQTEKLNAYYAALDARDPGLKERWMDPAIDASKWRTVEMPVFYGNNPLGCYLGVEWYRKDVQIPPAWVGKDLELHVGAVDEADDTFVNGTKVGRLWFDTPDFWKVPRVYRVPAAAVTSAKVCIVVRTLNYVGDIGLFGPAAEMRLAPTGDKTAPAVPLTGPWRVKDSLAFNGDDRPAWSLPAAPGSSAGEPATLYNGMVNPLVPYAIKGAIWYQGEANAGDPVGYRTLFPGLITSWRTAWGEGDFPFAFVQLANFMAVQKAPVERQSWADLRDAQTRTLALKNTGMACIIDIGEAGNIHPTDKQDVGKRLALAMLDKVYGQKLVYAGPMYKSLKREGNTLRLRFDFAGGLTVKQTPNAKADQLYGFAIAGADHVFHAAKARIDRETVVVWSDKVKTPLAVRYGWANNPVCNLYNAANLPAVPFQTDDWGQNFTVADENISQP